MPQVIISLLDQDWLPIGLFSALLRAPQLYSQKVKRMKMIAM